MIKYRERSEVQEALVHLYLRLNGYFVTHFIVHDSVRGRNRTEIDALAVRFPHNREPEREIEPSEFLCPSSQLIDVLICEVKSQGQRLQFNRSLRQKDSILSVLRWIGVFPEPMCQKVALQILGFLKPSNNQQLESIPEIVEDQIRLRLLLCCPERPTRDKNQLCFLAGEEIFNYIWRCLCPLVDRSACTTRYDFTLWGQWLEPIVRYFKNRARNGEIDAGSIETLYDYLRDFEQL